MNFGIVLLCFLAGLVAGMCLTCLLTVGSEACREAFMAGRRYEQKQRLKQAQRDWTVHHGWEE